MNVSRVLDNILHILRKARQIDSAFKA